VRRPIAFLAAFLLSASWTSSFAQTVNTPEDVIRRIVDQGFLDGHDNKLIGGTGDAAAVILTKILRGRVATPDQLDRILIVLNMAFGGETSGPDAEPKTALFVLRELELSTSAAQLRGRIGQTRKYVEEEFSKSNDAGMPSWLIHMAPPYCQDFMKPSPQK
jgi:hypothetical protein